MKKRRKYTSFHSLSDEFFGLAGNVVPIAFVSFHQAILESERLNLLVPKSYNWKEAAPRSQIGGESSLDPSGVEAMLDQECQPILEAACPHLAERNMNL